MVFHRRICESDTNPKTRIRTIEDGEQEKTNQITPAYLNPWRSKEGFEVCAILGVAAHVVHAMPWHHMKRTYVHLPCQFPNSQFLCVESGCQAPLTTWIILFLLPLALVPVVGSKRVDIISVVSPPVNRCPNRHFRYELLCLDRYIDRGLAKLWTSRPFHPCLRQVDFIRVVIHVIRHLPTWVSLHTKKLADHYIANSTMKKHRWKSDLPWFGYGYRNCSVYWGSFHTWAKESWPWGCESPKESVQRPSQGTSKIM